MLPNESCRALCLGGLAVLLAAVPTAALDLTRAVVVSPPGLSRSEKKAVQMLVEEIEKRTRLLLPTTDRWPAANTPVIAVGNQATLSGIRYFISMSSTRSP